MTTDFVRDPDLEKLMDEYMVAGLGDAAKLLRGRMPSNDLRVLAICAETQRRTSAELRAASERLGDTDLARLSNEAAERHVELSKSMFELAATEGAAGQLKS